MQLLKNIFLGILLIGVLSIGGIVAGYMIGWRIESPSPQSTSWKLIDQSLKFSKLIDASRDGVWAQSTDGKLYYWKYCSNNIVFGYYNYYDDDVRCASWIPVDNIPNDSNKNKFQTISRDCPASDAAPRRTPGEIAECIQVSGTDGGGGYAIYVARMQDGTVWVWFLPRGTDAPILSFFICPSIGLVLGVLISLILIILQYNKKQRSNSHVGRNFKKIRE